MFYGKYRGKVINNVDPLMLGRILALVPAVSGLPLTWALPAAPFAGSGVGFFALPPIGANVWIEFEGGDSDYPIWSGCFWGEGEVPAQPPLPTTFMIKTQLATLSINDLTAELRLEAKTPSGLQTVVLNAEGVKLSSDTVSVTITPQSIELKHTGSIGTVAPEGITFESGAASVKVTPAAIDIENGAAGAHFTPASISLKNAAASIDLSLVAVSLNDGALEVM